jgi:hypothetical protein|eukprot:SAG25_NODE_2413_length_1631_cov_3.782081_3_plen_145_part_00
MQRTPLSFVGYQGLRWGGGPAHGGTEIFFRGTYVSEGTTPAGSVWAQNPIPLTAGDDGLPDDAPSGTPVFKPKCTNVTMCSHMGDGNYAIPDLEIVDTVRIPADIAPGDYVLGEHQRLLPPSPPLPRNEPPIAALPYPTPALKH